MLRRLSIALAALLTLTALPLALSAVQKPKPADVDTDDSELKPLVGIEQFMDNVLHPAYESVKDGLAAKPADKEAWKKIHTMSIILGESGNLLIFRKPEEAKAKDWNKMAVGLRDAGAGLVKATKSRNDQASLKSYRAVVDACNRCHQKFAEDGEPKIEP
jgi:hypothetical protein